MKTEYFRNLPHLQYVGAQFFITFCLKGSLPADVIQGLVEERDLAISRLQSLTSEGRYNEQKRYFSKIDRVLNA